MLHIPALLIASSLISSGAAASSGTLPTFRMTSLSGHIVTLPNAASGRAAILIIGFTQASSKATAAWHQKISPEIGQYPGCVIYDMAILEDVPRLFRGLVLGSIRNGVPINLRDTFLTTFENEKEWKRVVGYSDKDDAYVTLLGTRGEILWQTHGLTADARLSILRDRLRALAPSTH